MTSPSSLFDAAAVPLVLRDYQEAAIAELRSRWARGVRKVMVEAPTAAGKTVIAAALMAKTWESGSRTVFVCDRLTLVKQTADKLREHGIPFGVVQGDRHYGQSDRIIVASAQTLEKRSWPESDLLIIDEAHAIRKVTTARLGEHKGYAVGLSATPLTPGLDEIWDGIITVATTTALTEQGWLVPARIYAGVHADMTGAPMTGGEFTARGVEERGAVIIGDIFENWERRTKDHFGGRVKTLVFSATVPHGEQICAEFQRHGVDARQISYLDRDRAAREALIEDFKSGEPGSVMVLVSCEALTKGFDAPNVMCLVNAREYRKSIASHIQQLGRGLRMHPGKEYVLVLDHTQNTRGFLDQTLDIWDNGVGELPSKARKRDTVRKEGEDRDGVECQCGMILAGRENPCPGCGFERKRVSTVEHVPGTLGEIDISRTPNGIADVDVAALASSSSTAEKRALWRSICDEIERSGSGGEKRALAIYREWMEEWPPYGAGYSPRGDFLDKRVRTRISNMTKAYWARQRGRQKAGAR